MADSVDSTVKYGRQCGGAPPSATDTLALSVSPLKTDTIGGPPGPVSTSSVVQPKSPP